MKTEVVFICFFFITIGLLTSSMLGVSINQSSDAKETVAEDEYWLEGWHYRKSHLTDAGEISEENFQVQIVVHYEEGNDTGNNVFCEMKCDSEFQDIRFTDADGITQLDYWLQDFTPDDYAIFWILIPEMVGAVNIYIYYGNEGISTTSNGFTTFPLFDDFNREDSSVIGNNWTEDEYDGVLNIDNNQLQIGQNGNEYCHIEREAPNLETFVLRGKLTAEYYCGWTWYPSICVYWDTFVWVQNGIDASRYRGTRYNINESRKVNTKPGAAVSTYYHFRIIVDTQEVYIDWSSDSINWVRVCNVTRPSSWNGTAQLIIVGKGSSHNSDVESAPDLDNNASDPGTYVETLADDIFIRKYTGSDPIHQEWGNEEALLTTYTTSTSTWPTSTTPSYTANQPWNTTSTTNSYEITTSPATSPHVTTSPNGTESTTSNTTTGLSGYDIWSMVSIIITVGSGIVIIVVIVLIIRNKP